MATAFSIDEFRRKQRVKEARARRKRPPLGAAKSSGRPPAASAVGHSGRRDAYSPQQRAYLEFCMQKSVDPDGLLLAELARRQFLLKLDRFGEDEVGRRGFEGERSWREADGVTFSSARAAHAVPAKDERLPTDLPLARLRRHQPRQAGSLYRDAASCVGWLTAACSNAPDLRIKFDRLGLKRALAYSKRGASISVRYGSRVLA